MKISEEEVKRRIEEEVKRRMNELEAPHKRSAASLKQDMIQDISTLKKCNEELEESSEGTGVRAALALAVLAFADGCAVGYGIGFARCQWLFSFS